MVKESDSKSDGLCPRGFESPRCRSFFPIFLFTKTRVILDYLSAFHTDPNIAQLVERSTVELAGIEWSLVRFRVFGVFNGANVNFIKSSVVI